jgi:hypothetical protein
VFVFAPRYHIQVPEISCKLNEKKISADSHNHYSHFAKQGHNEYMHADIVRKIKKAHIDMVVKVMILN